MQNLISNELLSEVFNKNVIYTRIYNQNILNITWDIDKKLNVGTNINIYELANKCKEWATKHNFHLVSWTISYEAVKNKGYCQTHNTQDSTKENDKPFRESTEIKAIFKACQWILDNKED